MVDDTSAARRESSSAPVASSHTPVKPLIAWDRNRTNTLDSLNGEDAAPSQDWLDDFLNNLGQPESLRNPNAGMRVRANAASAGMGL
jgi:hypothetical protein